MIIPTSELLRFSIVIACYNQRGFVRDAVNSALLQSTASKEVIVVDDGSSDGTAEIVKEYGGAIRPLLLEKNGGALEARNRGVSLAKGEYIVFLDGDDLLMPWALETYEQVIAKRSPMLILGEVRWFEGAVPPLSSADIPKEVKFVEYQAPVFKDRANRLTGSAFVVERNAFQDVGGWSPDIFYNDIPDMIAKLGLAGRLILIRHPMTVFYRIHSANSIHSLPPFIRTIHMVMEKEKTGQYPRSGEHRFARYAWLGGIVFYWTKRSLLARRYKDTLKLVALGWPMIMAAIARRCVAWIRGRRPIETIELTHT